MNEEEQYLSIGKVAKILGVAVVTLRRWEKLGKLKAKFRTFGHHRRYFVFDVFKILNKNKRVNVCYARVSSCDQKQDLERQSKYLENYCIKNNISFELIKDLGSGLNFKKKGLNKLISMIISSQIETIYLTHKDRLLRFGSELIVAIAKKFGTNIIFLNDTKQSFEEQLSSDVLEIITVFSAKLYGSRSHKNKQT